MSVCHLASWLSLSPKVTNTPKRWHRLTKLSIHRNCEVKPCQIRGVSVVPFYKTHFLQKMQTEEVQGVVGKRHPRDHLYVPIAIMSKERRKQYGGEEGELEDKKARILLHYKGCLPTKPPESPPSFPKVVGNAKRKKWRQDSHASSFLPPSRLLLQQLHQQSLRLLQRAAASADFPASLSRESAEREGESYRDKKEHCWVLLLRACCCRCYYCCCCCCFAETAQRMKGGFSPSTRGNEPDKSSPHWPSGPLCCAMSIYPLSPHPLPQLFFMTK